MWKAVDFFRTGGARGPFGHLPAPFRSLWLICPFFRQGMVPRYRSTAYAASQNAVHSGSTVLSRAAVDSAGGRTPAPAPPGRIAHPARLPVFWATPWTPFPIKGLARFSGSFPQPVHSTVPRQCGKPHRQPHRQPRRQPHAPPGPGRCAPETARARVSCRAPRGGLEWRLHFSSIAAARRVHRCATKAAAHWRYRTGTSLSVSGLLVL